MLTETILPALYRSSAHPAQLYHLNSWGLLHTLLCAIEEARGSQFS